MPKTFITHFLFWKINQGAKMEEFFIQNSIYVVLVIVLVIFTGLFFYLVRLERKLTELEQMFSEQDETAQKR
jgi:CcmD family protein